ncbi:MAG: nicotinamide-nucleotide amidohydrolase family protein [Planctomycetaceae bacterium]|nr:nicotinamide-nucleotide amidohydrolase family protein [Planctomycetaceae bacterium]
MTDPEVQRLAHTLDRAQLRIVFAESCTAGMVAGLLAGVPGISACLSGSMVTYRPECKIDWLGVSPTLIEEHTTVSWPVTRAMARSVLAKTSSADLSAAVTGHLGPNAPADLDGMVYIVVARRRTGATRGDSVEIVMEHQERLQATDRIQRQLEAARKVIATVTRSLPDGE